MILIDPSNAINAIGMLLGQFSMHLGRLGSTDYYLVDGKVWMKADAGLVFRSDNSFESAYLMKLLKEHDRRKDDVSPA